MSAIWDLCPSDREVVAYLLKCKVKLFRDGTSTPERDAAFDNLFDVMLGRHRAKNDLRAMIREEIQAALSGQCASADGSHNMGNWGFPDSANHFGSAPEHT